MLKIIVYHIEHTKSVFLRLSIAIVGLIKKRIPIILRYDLIWMYLE